MWPILLIGAAFGIIGAALGLDGDSSNASSESNPGEPPTPEPWRPGFTTCHRCGRTLSSPIYHHGRAYGSTCIHYVR